MDDLSCMWHQAIVGLAAHRTVSGVPQCCAATPNPKPQTPNPKPQTPKPELQALNLNPKLWKSTGAPSSAETYQYARTLLGCATSNSDGGNRALLVGGGIANFTDVAATFKGIIQVLLQQLPSPDDAVCQKETGGHGAGPHSSLWLPAAQSYNCLLKLEHAQDPLSVPKMSPAHH